MGTYHLPLWLQAAVAASGGLGLLLLSFLDSTFLPFPSVNDLLLIDLSIQFPLRMPYYAAMAILGSLGGCLILYFLGRKGGEAAFRAQAGDRSAKIEHWVQRNGFVSMLIAALAPPPMPLKFFVLAAGALKMPVRQFTLSLLLARVLRFYVEGYLAVRYGQQAAQFLIAHKVALGVATMASIIVSYLFVRVLFRQAPERQS
jgi:membrane protein YqaA with SNARE-associated domain